MEIEGGRQSSAAAFCSVGGWAAVILLVYSLLTIIILILLGGAPENAQACFDMIESNVATALLRLDVLTVIVMPIFCVLYAGLYATMSRGCFLVSTLSLASAMMGVTLILANASPASLVYLSHQYAAATTEPRRAALIAAGEALISADMWHGTAAKMGGLLLQLAGVLISFAMLRTAVFSKLIGYLGVIAHGLDLLHIVIGFFAPKIGVIAMAIGGPLYLIWFPLVARRLFQLAKAHDEPSIGNPG